MTSLIEAERRVVELNGANNFRDIGGYRTQAGAVVRTGLVYRSGSLAGLTTADQVLIARLGIRHVCDFRSNRERAHGPANWPPGETVQFWWRDHEHSVGNVLKEILEHPQPSAGAVRDWMTGVYRDLPFEQAESYTALFRRIADGKLPLLFHCAAGKDRTGIAAALLLELLGVDRETIMQDYLLTNSFLERIGRLVMSEPGFARYAHIDPEILHPMLGVEPAYLQAAYAVMAQKYGSVREYMRDALVVDEAMEQAIRARLFGG